MIELLDHPLAQIRIEVHIFETNETDALRLGLEFSGRGIAADGTLSPTDGGVFGPGLVFGPQETSHVMWIDAALRFRQSLGRVLSRPVVVTANNIEAEMNSGSVLNIRLIGEKTTSLQELKTGVTLRVSLRLISVSADNQSHDRILLNVFAETSSPMASSVIDGIPPINSQRAHSEVIVEQGQPFLVCGLIRNRRTLGRRWVPFFQDLSLLCPWFRSESSSGQFDHILVFVTPTQVKPETRQSLLKPENLKRTSSLSR